MQKLNDNVWMGGCADVRMKKYNVQICKCADV